ncbi:NYN domain-containing protein [Burkholderia sp. BCCIQ04A]|uniref:NYN domain-containing protein n=1 Tax=Burkholderia anthinoferrum TaxID=3090833 RepID=A0ABU5WI95_9BURK|nr:NYN domain-containing protein [Burkholderia anthinoferrum]MEB2501879.1 NYN domain-containing protein [Burkholderia anthinoferrum]MEB2529770.1 NYN domain-containing protein [Burkholderia anthinoferrum]MEB2563465.1 NYN domain-containing protein [Burkholderia anthinoferrum]MEB2578677.1 NYN domain-containing protein [Burkholderia anthinoferrum]MEB2632208.1 NYN domain-containing protein [Burkholderia anthinoferrum]
MALPLDNVSMAVFCDFENVALGVRDAKYEKFDIKPVLERLLLKGSIVVKKAYCDWDRYKGFKASMHEASFELIEIPHVRQSGKNSADIRLVVDALDLCYTKSHVDTFVIISGDSDFSPLVSKLRENAKKVIGVGVKKSTSDLLVANCDEFIFYDDLVREQQRALAKREQQQRAGNGGAKRPDEPSRKHDMEARKAEAIALAVETFDALASERDDVGKIWASVLKSAIKRRKPDFNESYYGFRAFGNLLDEAQARGLLEVGRDDKSGAFVSRARQSAAEHAAAADHAPARHGRRPAEPVQAEREPRHHRGRGRHGEPVGEPFGEPFGTPFVQENESVETAVEFTEADEADVTVGEAAAAHGEPAGGHDDAKTARKRARKTPAKKAGTKKGGDGKNAGRQAAVQEGDAPRGDAKHGGGKHAEAMHRDGQHDDGRAAGAAPARGETGGDAVGEPAHDAPVHAEPVAAVADAPAPAKPKKPARKAAPRARRPRKTAEAAE